MKQEEAKLKVIFQIDGLESTFRHTIYERELKKLRAKYIYKDISNPELLNDIKYLKELKKLTK
jgi:hypothetical protein